METIISTIVIIACTYFFTRRKAGRTSTHQGFVHRATEAIKL